MNIDAYLKAADRGDFQWSPIDTDAWTGQVISEECEYKGKGCNTKITRTSKDEYEIEITLDNEPYYICDYRSSRRSAREYVERIIRNYKSGNWQKNMKYVKY